MKRRQDQLETEASDPMTTLLKKTKYVYYTMKRPQDQLETAASAPMNTVLKKNKSTIQ